MQLIHAHCEVMNLQYVVFIVRRNTLKKVAQHTATYTC